MDVVVKIPHNVLILVSSKSRAVGRWASACASGPILLRRVRQTTKSLPKILPVACRLAVVANRLGLLRAAQHKRQAASL